MTYKTNILCALVSIVLLYVFFFIPVVLAQEVNMIEELPGQPNLERGDNLLPTYLSWVFRLSLGIGAILAVFFIVLGGVRYTLTSISPSEKNAAKDMIWNAIYGLLIILAAFLVLRTINPDLVNFNLLLPSIRGGVPTEPPEREGPETRPQPPEDGRCNNCISVESFGFPSKKAPQGCRPNPPDDPCKVNDYLAIQLSASNADFEDAGINWEVTEMWPPTRAHRAACHQTGDCVDASIRSARNAENINAAITIFKDNNLRPVYEVPNANRREDLIRQGVPAGDIIVVPGITGEHFSVYKQ
jgi:hypothetical protein